MFAINAAMIAVLVIAGLVSGSLAVLAAGAEYLADAAAIGLSLWALHLAGRQPKASRSFGYHRATVLAALANTVLILTVAVIVAIGAISRLLRNGHEVHGGPALIAALVAMVAMGAAALLLVGDDDLSVRSVLLDTAGDAVAAGAVAVASAIIWLAHGRFTVLDPIVALAVTAVIGWHAFKLLRDTAAVLLQWAPDSIDVGQLGRTVCEEIPEVTELHDVHLWSLTADAQVFSAHVQLRSDCTLGQVGEVLNRIKQLLHDRYGIEHMTLEPELVGCVDAEVCVNPIEQSESAGNAHRH